MLQSWHNQISFRMLSSCLPSLAAAPRVTVNSSWGLFISLRLSGAPGVCNMICSSFSQMSKKKCSQLEWVHLNLFGVHPWFLTPLEISERNVCHWQAQVAFHFPVATESVSCGVHTCPACCQQGSKAESKEADRAKIQFRCLCSLQSFNISSPCISQGAHRSCVYLSFDP